jgi:hypothetical protein
MKKFTTELSSKKQEYGNLSIVVHDKHGNKIHELEQSVDSFNQTQWVMLQHSLSGVSTFSYVNLLGTNSTYTCPNPQYMDYDSIRNAYNGILVGSGTSQTTINKQTFDNIIQLGSGSNQLEAQIATAEWDAANQIATLTRPFVNLSSNQATLSINEVGIAAGPNQTLNIISVWLVVRDVLLSTIDVPYEATLTVQYRLRMSIGTNNMKNVFVKPMGLNVGTSGTARYGLANITGAIVSIAECSGARIFSSEGMTNRGLIFGTSNNAFNVTQLDLGGKIAHGSNAGQLFYHSTTNSNIFINTTTNSLYFQFFRSVENRSGSNIDIQEIGVFTDGGVAGVQSFMLDRRVIDPPVTITNGNIVSFTWEFCYEV